MTQQALLWVIALTALLTAPAAMLLFAVLQRLAPWLRRQLPLRHLVGRGWRKVRRNEEEEDPEEPLHE
ncbi:hypothetical protein [Pseudomonas citronellolis]|uniref:hypothetical protein n=1 Tax=Pseudomonas citronellolis TaxID=53408 RepID=UPI0023E3FC20|nr:hypothetical protein [Pseudomonas citronellolis]MDF3931318.1 hypothetical protein [Pseudomonas citronellolis]